MNDGILREHVATGPDKRASRQGRSTSSYGLRIGIVGELPATRRLLRRAIRPSALRDRFGRSAVRICMPTQAQQRAEWGTRAVFDSLLSHPSLREGWGDPCSCLTEKKQVLRLRAPALRSG